jgi:hypothetical protein
MYGVSKKVSMYTTFCYLSTYAPPKRPTITVVPLCHRKFGDLRTTLFAVLFLLAACSWRAATSLLIYILAPHIVAQVKSPLYLRWVSGHNLRDTLVPSARLKESGCVTFFNAFLHTFLDWSRRLF